MNLTKLLDCTLRDGGYVNDWNFGRDTIINIFERLVSSEVDAIEVGFLDQRRPFDPNRTIMPNTESINKIFGKLNPGKSMIVAMIDYGTCDLENIQPCEDCFLDGIRVIFKKERMHEAIAFCKGVKGKGYKVFIQAVSITSYSDEELCELIELVNDCHPYAMSMVDTYGLLNADWLSHIMSVIDNHLAPDIILGYHAHNNFQLGYANAMAMLNSKLNRDVLVDGTLYGMGKSAGNAPLELIAMYMNANLGKNYGVLHMQEAIATGILDIYRKTPWGYTLFFYIAASNKCHPDYVSYLMNKRTLSVTSVNEILQQIPDEEKLNKNMKLIEQLYLNYQTTECNDAHALAQLQEKLAGKKVLMVGPGVNAKAQVADIHQYVTAHKPVVIAINYLPDSVTPDYLFLTNSRRYLQMASQLTGSDHSDIPLIATSNVTRTGGQFPYLINYSSLIDPEAEFPDNSMVMLLKLLGRVGVHHCALAGFDGYTPDTLNYFDANKEYSFVREKADALNQYAKDFFKSIADKMDICFVTKSYYQE